MDERKKTLIAGFSRQVRIAFITAEMAREEKLCGRPISPDDEQKILLADAFYEMASDFLAARNVIAEFHSTWMIRGDNGL